MSRPEVRVLCEGLIRREGQVVIEAHSSSTLVTCEGLKMVVDTSSLEYRGKVLSSLEELGVRPEKVQMVVNTHLHHDHIANNDLFPKAKVLSFMEEPHHDQIKKEICPGVRLVSTPGHVPGSVSVFVEAERKYAIVGDAIPTENNYLKWVPPALNYDPVLAMESMARIVDFADIVIPGHGTQFAVKRDKFNRRVL